MIIPIPIFLDDEDNQFSAKERLVFVLLALVVLVLAILGTVKVYNQSKAVDEQQRNVEQALQERNKKMDKILEDLR